MTAVLTSQVSVVFAPSLSKPPARVAQTITQVAVAPPSSKDIRGTQRTLLLASSAGTKNVATRVTQVAVMAAYYTGQPSVSRQTAWTFIMDGHRFYVLPLGKEGDWAYDTTTKEWCQLQSTGFDGLNFTHGVMWGLRVIGGDSLYPYLYELDPNQSLDEGWRQINHIVTGGIPTRGRSTIGVANFTLTASVADLNALNTSISLAFSDDNGVTWSKEFTQSLTDSASQLLIWNALGSFDAPGRVFRITDLAGPVRLDGADVVLTNPTGADSGQGQE
jgi:hypothetical protein